MNLEGKAISHYRILEKIGEGGMGVVYKAEDTKLKRTVALKFLPSHFYRDKEARERFLREAQAAAGLDHPNICTVHEINDEGEQTFIAMNFVPGQSLAEKIAAGPLEIGIALGIAVQVAEGLKEAHSQGVIHRDIKPGNILLNDKGQVKITDFGLAKLSGVGDLTKTATILGTVAYMSPEQATGQEVDLRTDIWSFGCMLHEMLTGDRPFEVADERAMLHAILYQEPRPVTKTRKDIPPALERVIFKALEKDPQNRTLNMQELIQDLKKISNKLKAEQKQPPAPHKKPSVAVLPFVNMSADPENEYFSDGLAEDLINALTKITELHVVARTSSFSFKGEKADIREIGQKLNVDHLLEGSVRKVGDRVRITAQLIKVKDGFHLWSERYDRNLEDVFAIQDEITDKITEKLKVALAVAEKPIEEARSINLEAYDLYLKGRYHGAKFQFDKALFYYEKALKKDPDYALAFAAIAESYTILSQGFDILPSKEAMPKAKEAAQKALEIDPNLAEAYVSLGLVAMSYDFDPQRTRQYLLKALELNPNASSAHQWIEFYWTYFEMDLDRAAAHLERALELDPLNLLIKVRQGFVLMFRRDKGSLERALELFKEIVEFEPSFALGYLSIMTVYAVMGDFKEAVIWGEKVLDTAPPTVAYLGNLGWVYKADGQKDKTRKILAELLERSKKGYVSSFWISILYVCLGEIDKAFAWLDKAYEERDGSLIYVTVPPPFDPVRADPRYKQLLDKMGLGHLWEKLVSLSQ
jgi:serine/threonine protein kinase/cytochrome c-type biogenesis protein CcmH/NrfG